MFFICDFELNVSLSLKTVLHNQYISISLLWTWFQGRGRSSSHLFQTPPENKLTAYIRRVSVQSIQLVFIIGLNPVPSISISLGSNVIDIVNLLGSLSLSLYQKGFQWNKQLATKQNHFSVHKQSAICSLGQQKTPCSIPVWWMLFFSSWLHHHHHHLLHNPNILFLINCLRNWEFCRLGFHHYHI